MEAEKGEKTTAPRIRADGTPSSQPQHAPEVCLSLSLSHTHTLTHTHTHTHTHTYGGVGEPLVAGHFKAFSQCQALLFWRAHATPYKAY